jgi:hypothetical protein
MYFWMELIVLFWRSIFNSVREDQTGTLFFLVKRLFEKATANSIIASALGKSV